jgi:DNA-binding CsgD family transcriptional regulator
MWRAVAIWAAVLALAAFGLDWIRYQFLIRTLPPQIYVSVIAMAFAAGGVWLGWRLTARPHTGPFEPNLKAQASLGLTGQEMKVLALIVAGQSNKEIARALGLSPNTVKTHLANLFAKLSVGRRTQAVARARELGLAP